jgi:hypothetical protein
MMNCHPERSCIDAPIIDRTHRVASRERLSVSQAEDPCYPRGTSAPHNLIRNDVLAKGSRYQKKRYKRKRG